MSALTKDCPRCGKTTSLMANSCRCGHIFEADPGSAEFVEMASQEEEAYEAYLEARLDQARIAAERAIQILTQDPSDQQNIIKAKRANHELERINNEYAAQLAEVEKTQLKVRNAKSITQKKQSDSQTASAKSTSRSSFSPPRIVSLSSSAVSAERAREMREAPVPSPAPTSRAITRARSGRVRLEASEAILARRAAQQLIAQRAEAIASRKPGQTTMSQQMRETTRDKAEKVVIQARSSSSRISGDLAAAVKALDTKVNSGMMSKTIMECPNCTTRLPVTAEQCGCGYQFNAGAEGMPGLSLDAKDLQNLF